MNNLEQYLRTNWQRGYIDYKLRCYNDGTFFYVVPDSYSKTDETPNFRVEGNTLIPQEDVTQPKNDGPRN